MELLTKLFFTHGAVQTVLVLSLTIVFGILLGKIKFFSVSFGIGGILFSGIILGHFGLSLNPDVLVFTREFGLVLFVYAIGIAVGPTFLESLKDQGLKLNLMALFIVCCGAFLAVVCYYVFDLSIPQMVGMYSGAVTNTPGLGSANEAWNLTAQTPEIAAEGLKIIGMAYAVAYPFGIFGIILTMMLLKGIFHINVQEELMEIAAGKNQNKIAGVYSDATGLLATSSNISGIALENIIPADVVVTAIKRGEEIHQYNGQWKLRLADTIFVKGNEEGIKKLSALLGNNPSALSHPQMLSIFIGIFIGVFAGSIPIFIPGLPTGLRLGVAGGTLLAAIYFSRVQKIGPFIWYMQPGMTALMREIGILLFLACVGINAGAGFVNSIINGPGLQLMGYGAIVTFVPLFIAALICRAWWKLKFPVICGMLAGSLTDPPALAFAMQYYGGEIPASAYSTVYPLTMILRILIGQLLVMGLVAFL